jgi:hypothetical protein
MTTTVDLVVGIIAYVDTIIGVKTDKKLLPDGSQCS